MIVPLNPLCYSANLFYFEAMFYFEGFLELFLAGMFFTADNKGIATKLAEKMEREHTADEARFYHIFAV